MKSLQTTLAWVAAAIMLFAPLTALAQSQIWRFPTGGIVQSSPVLGPDGTLYVGSGDNFIYAINTVGSSSVAAGSLRWKF